MLHFHFHYVHYVVEDWYYAVWAYNGWGYVNNPNNLRFPRDRDPWECWRNPNQDKDDYPYQELIWGCAAHPPDMPTMQPTILLWDPVLLTLPPRELITDPPPQHIDTPLPYHGSCSVTYLPILLNAESCEPLVQNGGFENGSSPWVLGGFTYISIDNPHTGSYSAWLGGNNYAYDTLYQMITIPGDATSANISYYWYMDTEEWSHPWDYMYVKIRNASGYDLRTLEVISDGSTPNSWVLSSFDIREFIGQTVQVYFEAITDGSLVTDFFVDDVSLNICSPGGAPFVTPTPIPTNTPSPTTAWTFSGSVTDSVSSLPVSGATVTLYRLSGLDWQAANTVTTGADGQFNLDYIGPPDPNWFLLLTRYPTGYVPALAQPGSYFFVVSNQILMSTEALLPGEYNGQDFFGLQQPNMTPVPETPTPPPLPTVPLPTVSPSPTIISPLPTPTP